MGRIVGRVFEEKASKGGKQSKPVKSPRKEENHGEAGNAETKAGNG